MDLTLRTERLVLTPLEMTDTDLAVELWTDPEVVRYICDVPTAAEVRGAMPNAIKRGGDGSIGEWCIAERESGDKIGTVYFLPMPTVDDDINYDLVVSGQIPDADIELGYFFKPSAWHRGYATEVSGRVLQFAFGEASLEEIVASVHDDNVASKNVLEKAGFVFRGRAMCWGKDTPLYAITRDQWQQRRHSK